VPGSNATPLYGTGSFVPADGRTGAAGPTVWPDNLAMTARSMPPAPQEPARLFPHASASPPPILPTAGSGGLLGMLMRSYESQPPSDVDSNPQQAPLPQPAASTPQPSIPRLVSTRNGVPISPPSPATVTSQNDPTLVRRFPGPIFDSPDRAGTSGSDDRQRLAYMLAGLPAAAPQKSKQPVMPFLMDYIRYL
jgi:hypothetical protein